MTIKQILVFLQDHGATLIALLMVAIVFFATLFIIYVAVLAKRKKFYLLKLEDGAISPASISAYVALLAAVIGALWLAFSVGVSGSLELQRLSLESGREKNIAILDVEINVQQFCARAPKQTAPKTWPVHFAIAVKNKGPKAADLNFDILPLMTVSAASKLDSGVTVLPYESINCNQRGMPCTKGKWKTGYLEPDGTGYYSFLHPGLAAGVYFAQFQLPVEKTHVRSTIFDPDKIVVSQRSLYFEVSESCDLKPTTKG